MTPPAARIPVKLHKQVTLIRTADPILAEELLARKTLARLVAGRLSETVLLVRPRRRTRSSTSCGGWATPRGSSAERTRRRGRDGLRGPDRRP